MATEKFLKGECIILELRMATTAPTGNARAPKECMTTSTFSGASPAIKKPAPGRRFRTIIRLFPVFLNK
jgi:hypothetical protein